MVIIRGTYLPVPTCLRLPVLKADRCGTHRQKADRSQLYRYPELTLFMSLVGLKSAEAIS